MASRPVCSRKPLNWTDAIFTSTSAVCVTGLIVVDTATYFTFAGQLLLLSLIQLGGLGMLTLTSMIIAAIGGRLSVRSEAVAVSSQQAVPHIPTRALIISVVRFTLLFEVVGTLLLYGLWGPQLGWREAMWPAVFHAISAFCNAGFSTHSDSLVRHQGSPGTIAVVSCLIVAGGLGFVAIEEITHVFSSKSRRRRRLSAHTQLVIYCTSLLLIVGWVLFALIEWNGVLRELSLVDRLSNSLFMSVTASAPLDSIRWTMPKWPTAPISSRCF